MTPADLMAKAIEAAAETHTTVAWLNIAADALENALEDDTLDVHVQLRILRGENGVLLALAMLKGVL